jgi:ribosomal protein S18 acetylase RimI-like enzyme
MSCGSSLEIRPAREEDTLALVDLHNEAVEWQMATTEPPHWTPTNERQMRNQMENGEVYLGETHGHALAAGRLVAALTLYWEADAGHIRKLTVRSSLHGHGIGERMLSWANGEVARRGKPYVRLDCPESNTRLREYYISQGFAFLGIVENAGYRGALYQRPAGI